MPKLPYQVEKTKTSILAAVELARHIRHGLTTSAPSTPRNTIPDWDQNLNGSHAKLLLDVAGSSPWFLHGLCKIKCTSLGNQILVKKICCYNIRACVVVDFCPYSICDYAIYSIKYTIKMSESISNLAIISILMVSLTIYLVQTIYHLTSPHSSQ